MHHFDDGRNAASLLAQHDRFRAVVLDLARCVGAVAQLVLEPHDLESIARAVRRDARHEEAARIRRSAYASVRKASDMGAEQNHLCPMSR